MQLFIDTNVFLSFYHMTNEDLIELQKLVRLIGEKEVILHLPQQVIDETWRNRAAKINDSLSPFQKAKFSLAYPSYCKAYEEYDKMRTLQKETEKQHANLIQKIEADVAKRNLKADILLNELFGMAKTIERSPSIIAKARERMDLGNPPGKKGSLGDAINWECLLESVPKGYTLILIADDSDFSSPLDTYKINEFLAQEWGRGIIFYRRLSDFFKKHYPDINLETETQKDALIESLASSASFASTHAAIAALSKHNGFTQKQIEDIVSAVLLNNQVGWILGDDDVYVFYSMIHDKYFFNILDHVDELGQRLEKEKALREAS